MYLVYFIVHRHLLRVSVLSPSKRKQFRQHMWDRQSITHLYLNGYSSCVVGRPVLLLLMSSFLCSFYKCYCILVSSYILSSITLFPLLLSHHNLCLLRWTVHHLGPDSELLVHLQLMVYSITVLLS